MRPALLQCYNSSSSSMRPRRPGCLSSQGSYPPSALTPTYFPDVVHVGRWFERFRSDELPPWAAAFECGSLDRRRMKVGGSILGWGGMRRIKVTTAIEVAHRQGPCSQQLFN